MFQALPLLSLTIWVPIVFGILVLFFSSEKLITTARWLALAGALLGFLVCIPLYTGFNVTTASLQFRELMPWIERFNIRGK